MRDVSAPPSALTPIPAGLSIPPPPSTADAARPREGKIDFRILPFPSRMHTHFVTAKNHTLRRSSDSSQTRDYCIAGA